MPSIKLEHLVSTIDTIEQIQVHYKPFLNSQSRFIHIHSMLPIVLVN
nr:MAG TPA: hypothetical protein [Caudoviricetes sp.]